MVSDQWGNLKTALDMQRAQSSCDEFLESAENLWVNANSLKDTFAAAGLPIPLHVRNVANDLRYLLLLDEPAVPCATDSDVILDRVVPAMIDIRDSSPDTLMEDLEEAMGGVEFDLRPTYPEDIIIGIGRDVDQASLGFPTPPAGTPETHIFVPSGGLGVSNRILYTLEWQGMTSEQDLIRLMRQQFRKRTALEIQRVIHKLATQPAPGVPAMIASQPVTAAGWAPFVRTDTARTVFVNSGNQPGEQEWWWIDPKTATDDELGEHRKAATWIAFNLLAHTIPTGLVTSRKLNSFISYSLWYPLPPNAWSTGSHLDRLVAEGKLEAMTHSDKPRAVKSYGLPATPRA